MAQKRGVDQKQVVDAAIRLADSDGLDAVTLAGVAHALHVRSPSLYSHVDGLAGLRRAMAIEGARRVTSALADAARGLEGVEALRAVAHAYRSFATRHPGLYAAMLPAPRPLEDDEGYAVFAAAAGIVAEVLEGLGLSPADTIPAIRAFRSALHGFVSLEAAGGFGMPDDIDASFDVMVEILVAGVLSRGAPTPGGARAGSAEAT